ncbi:MAG: M23 family metallopeptidase [Fidelibacterota bacterium]
MRTQIVFAGLATLVLFSCAAPPPVPVPAPPPLPSTSFSRDSLSVIVTVPDGASQVATVLNSIRQRDGRAILSRQFVDLPDSLLDRLPVALFRYELVYTTRRNNETEYHFSLPYESVQRILTLLTTPSVYRAAELVYPLFSSGKNLPDTSVFSALRLPLPCDNVPVPDNLILIPNAPRKYRHGIHRGIDFYANWGTPVISVADGVVIRAEHWYREADPDFRVAVLNSTKELGRTPSDIFEHILVGQAVYIDHGFSLIPGYRCISIYAHLSSIDDDIIPGAQVKRGQEIGRSGNTGTRPSTLGTREGSHLHWELILQDKEGEYYLGQGIDRKELKPLLDRVFSLKLGE